MMKVDQQITPPLHVPSPHPVTSDRQLRQAVASVSPAPPPFSAISLVADWAMHLACAPDKQLSLIQSAGKYWLEWSRFVSTGCPDTPTNDLMNWNADGTRMPARMHSEYLRGIFLNNDLASNRYEVDGHAVSLRDIRIPVFSVGTETDHIAPWTSAYKIQAQTRGDVTFVLTNGGHNAGILSEPGHKRRHYRIHTNRDQDPVLSPEDWLQVADIHDGSWWLALSDWLAARSGPKAAPPKPTGDLGAAPGSYVLMP